MLASASGQRKRISQRSDTEGFLFSHARASHSLCTQVLARMWNRPSGPATLNSDCQIFYPLAGVPSSTPGAIRASALEEQSNSPASGRDGGSLDEDSMMED